MNDKVSDSAEANTGQSSGDTNEQPPKKDTTTKKKQKQPEPQDNVVTLKTPPNMEYDIGAMNTFLDFVFHDQKEDEEILAWVQKSNMPFFPQDIDKLLTKMDRSTRPFTFYYGTSTCQPAEDGKLYNRKALFKALHVVVLDDIGTKIPVRKLPAGFEPNYIIETSEGNFQYGYVLKEPIRDLAQAEALIHLVYTSGVSDNGGKMPTKVVRLPAGVNGKKGDKRFFQVRIEKMGGDYWTPEEILDVLDVGVTWKEVKEDATKARGGRSASKVGTSLWSPIKATAATLDGIVDPLLEWLYDNDMVVNDNGGWVTIECPWHVNHTSGANTAGYSPLGRGGAEYSAQRGFKCQHDHCSDKNTAAFLVEMVTQKNAPEVPIIDHAAELVANYALVTSEDSVYRIRGVKNSTSMKITAFRNAYPRSVIVYDNTGKPQKVKEHSLWLTAPNRLTLASRLYDPTSNERVVAFDGQQHLNTFTPPHWGNGAVNNKDVDRFLNFLEYLIPVDEEREYFIEWLAAKAKNVAFKGAAILMVAPVVGTGRTTLTDMLRQLFTPANVKKVNFDTLVNGTKDGAYNDWQESILVTCDEVLGADTNKYHVYEALKDMFDPRPMPTQVNTKYGTKREVVLYTSYVLLTNHTDAIGALGNDRRVYVISNTLIPNTPKYFTELDKWMFETDIEGNPAWCKSIWRYLLAVETDLTMLNAPAPTTQAKIEMIEETSNLNDAVAQYVVDALGDAFCNVIAKDLVIDILTERGVEYDTKVISLICKLMRDKTCAIPASMGGTLSIDKKTYRVRLNRAVLFKRGVTLVNKMTADEVHVFITTAKKEIAYLLHNRHEAIIKISEKLDMKGL